MCAGRTQAGTDGFRPAALVCDPGQDKHLAAGIKVVAVTEKCLADLAERFAVLVELECLLLVGAGGTLSVSHVLPLLWAALRLVPRCRFEPVTRCVTCSRLWRPPAAFHLRVQNWIADLRVKLRCSCTCCISSSCGCVYAIGIAS